MIVTALTSLRRGRVGLHLDGEFHLALHPDAAAGLTLGYELSPEELEERTSQSNLLFAKEKALYLLSARSYTCRGLCDKLATQWGEEAAAAAVERMLELGYLDDEDYARRYAADLFRKGRASGRVFRELMAKGIDREIAEAVLEDREDDPELAAAKVVRQKYLGCLEDEKGIRRTQNALIRLGYRYDVIRTVVGHLQEDPAYYDDDLE